jgi:hypothetical protein
MAAEPVQHVPFWLQVASIALAPILAVVGVAVGAHLNRQREHDKWLREERLRAYTDLLAIAHDMKDSLGPNVHSAMLDKDLALLSHPSLNDTKRLKSIVERIYLLGTN